MALPHNTHLDMVAKNRIWTEHIQKENRTIKQGETFAVRDPGSVTILPEKPNRMVPTKSPDQQSLDKANALLEELSYLKGSDRAPTERLALPLTHNMEYGFFSRPLQPPNPMFDYRGNSCDVTRYATTFVNNTGASPFSRSTGSG